MKTNLTKGIDLIIDEKSVFDTTQKESFNRLPLHFEIEGYDNTFRTDFSWYFFELNNFMKYFSIVSYSQNNIKAQLFYYNIFLIKNWNWDSVEKMILNLFKRVTLPNSLSLTNISEFLLQMDNIFYFKMREDAFWHYHFYNSDDEVAQITFSHAYEGCQFNHKITKKIYDLQEYRPEDENFFDLYLCFDIKLPSGYTTKGYFTLTTLSKFKARYDTVLNNSYKDFELAYKHLMIERYDPNIMQRLINDLPTEALENLKTDNHLLLDIGRIYHLEENFKLVY